MEENLRRQPGRSNKRAAVRLIQAVRSIALGLRLWSSLKTRRYLPRSAFARPSTTRSQLSLLDVYLEDGQVDN
jgi:hypothetical protein